MKEYLIYILNTIVFLFFSISMQLAHAQHGINTNDFKSSGFQYGKREMINGIELEGIGQNTTDPQNHNVVIPRTTYKEVTQYIHDQELKKKKTARDIWLVLISIITIFIIAIIDYYKYHAKNNFNRHSPHNLEHLSLEEQKRIFQSMSNNEIEKCNEIKTSMYREYLRKRGVSNTDQYWVKS